MNANMESNNFFFGLNTYEEPTINSLRRRSTGCFTPSKLLVPMQPLEESTSINTLNTLQDKYIQQQLLQQQHQQQLQQQNQLKQQLLQQQVLQQQNQQQLQQQNQLIQQPLEQQLSFNQWTQQRNTRSASFSVSQNTLRNQSSPVSVPKARLRRLSTSSIGTMSASSSFSSSITSSSSNIWERVLQQNMMANNAIRNNTKNLLLMANPSNKTSTTLLKIGGDEQNKELEEKIATTGNMFYRRDDWGIITQVPPSKQNTIHIRLEDDGPYGNDETRCFVLSHFSSLCIREMSCILCNDELKVYDRFPLVDGTLFMSPVCYDKIKAINASTANNNSNNNNKEQYIYGVCLSCLNGNNNIRCKWCKQEWKSESLQIGTLYKYDIFAAFPCCQKRFNCNKCNKAIIDVNNGENGVAASLPYFSSYSEEIECQHCKTRGYHFIKPLEALFK